jgi:hypothetical protein
MPCSTDPPKVSRYVCIVDQDASALAAVLSSFFFAPKSYFPVFLFPKVEVPKTEDPAFLSEDYAANLFADQVSVLIGNAIGRIRPELVILAGLSDAQKSFLSIPTSVRVIEISSVSEMDTKLSTFPAPENGELRCGTSDLLRGLYAAQRQHKKLVFDEDAELISDTKEALKGLIVVEAVANASPIIAVNYANAVDAKLLVVDALSRQTKTIFDCGATSRILRAACIPLSLGSPLSSKIKSGFSSWAFWTASNPSAISATTCNSACVCSMEQTYCRHGPK